VNDDRRRKRDDFLGEALGGGVEAGIEAGFAALAEAPPVAVVVGLVAGVGLLGFLAWKSFGFLAENKIKG
jgi:hypothetical protein